MAFGAIFMALLLVFGVPIFIWFWTRRLRQLNRLGDPQTLVNWGTFYERYDPSYCGFESIIMLKKLLVVLPYVVTCHVWFAICRANHGPNYVGDCGTASIKSAVIYELSANACFSFLYILLVCWISPYKKVWYTFRGKRWDLFNTAERVLAITVFFNNILACILQAKPNDVSKAVIGSIFVLSTLVIGAGTAILIILHFKQERPELFLNLKDVELVSLELDEQDQHHSALLAKLGEDYKNLQLAYHFAVQRQDQVLSTDHLDLDIAESLHPHVLRTRAELLSYLQRQKSFVTDSKARIHLDATISSLEQQHFGKGLPEFNASQLQDDLCCNMMVGLLSLQLSSNCDVVAYCTKRHRQLISQLGQTIAEAARREKYTEARLHLRVVVLALAAATCA